MAEHGATFGRRLQDLRLRAGLTQQSLAEKSGLTFFTIRNWEQGQRFPSALALYQLAQALGVTMESLVEGLQDSKAAPPKKARGKKRGGGV
jgi:transcriptional regulator with XRE-family HTH domain